MLMLTAKTWGGRPSAFLGPIAPRVALLLDDALAARWWQEAAQQSTSPDPEVLAAGGRYETPADWGIPFHDETRAQQARQAYRELLRAEGVKVH